MHKFFYFTIILFCSTAVCSAQTSPGPGIYFSAEWFDQFEGDARVAEIKKLQYNNWNTIDTIYKFDEITEVRPFNTAKRTLAPYMDEDGYVVHLVPDVAPVFPGGLKALAQYALESLGPYGAGSGDEVQQTVFIRYTIDLDGSIIHVEEAQKHPEWVNTDVLVQCLDTVRFMPKWAPGMDRGKPVRVSRMLSFSLK